MVDRELDIHGCFFGYAVAVTEVDRLHIRAVNQFSDFGLEGLRRESLIGPRINWTTRANKLVGWPWHIHIH